MACFAAAREALPRLGASDRVLDAVDEFTDRYVARGRCPADDLLDEVVGKGAADGVDGAIGGDGPGGRS